MEQTIPDVNNTSEAESTENIKPKELEKPTKPVKAPKAAKKAKVEKIAKVAKVDKDAIRRITTTIDFDMYSSMLAWADRLDISENQFCKDAITFYIRYCNKDFDIPDLLIQRINQVIDGMNVLSSNVQASTDIIIAGFDSITELARGDNYLLEADDGEL
jgi:hypothetical protein